MGDVCDRVDASRLLDEVTLSDFMLAGVKPGLEAALAALEA